MRNDIKKHSIPEEPIIAVDLDGTLAFQKEPPYGNPLDIGEPVPEMVERVKKWVAQGIRVEVFTARLHPKYPTEKREMRAHIEKWVKKNIGVILKVTAMKSPNFTEIWDDRAKRVKRNMGILE